MRVCTSCGRRFREEGYVRCHPCRERAKVYLHQLHKRREWAKAFRDHRCDLCRKYAAFCTQLNKRWDERGIWMWTRCSKGHKYQTWKQHGSYCYTCYPKEHGLIG
jgi:hypothetical protein